MHFLRLFLNPLSSIFARKNMNLDINTTLIVIEAMENFLDRLRPEPEIRKKLDFGYRIDNQSVYFMEIRPFFMDESRIIESDIAKATYVKSKNQWKVFWLRGNLKWHPYAPKPFVNTFQEFIDLVDEDEYHCFFG